MVAVVSGAGLGVNNTSQALIGPAGQLDEGSLGRANEQVTLNAATGNLVIQNRDEYLAGIGEDVGLLRTYNSQGGWDGDNNDNWRIGYYRRISGLTGTLNAAGSTLRRVGEDGLESVYTYDNGEYFSTDRGGAYDWFTVDAVAGTISWTDGQTHAVEVYQQTAAGSGIYRLTKVVTSERHEVRVTYDPNGLIDKLETWNAATNTVEETVDLTYDNATNKRLTQVETRYKDTLGANATRTRVRYEYDAAGRLEWVRTDLSPEDNSIADGRSYYVRYGYDASGRVNRITQSDGSDLGIVYDGSGRVSGFTDAYNRTTTIGYDAAARRTTVTDRLNQVTTLTYDASNRLTEMRGGSVRLNTHRATISGTLPG